MVSLSGRLKKLFEMLEDIEGLPPPGYYPLPPDLEWIYGSGVRGPEGKFISGEEIQAVLDKVFGQKEGGVQKDDEDRTKT